MSKKNYKKFKITAKGREYETPDGKKSYWNDIGIITLFSDDALPQEVSGMLEMHHMPGNEYKIFPLQKRNGDDSQRDSKGW